MWKLTTLFQIGSRVLQMVRVLTKRPSLIRSTQYGSEDLAPSRLASAPRRPLASTTFTSTAPNTRQSSHVAGTGPVRSPTSGGLDFVSWTVSVDAGLRERQRLFGREEAGTSAQE